MKRIIALLLAIAVVGLAGIAEAGHGNRQQQRGTRGRNNGGLQFNFGGGNRGHHHHNNGLQLNLGNRGYGYRNNDAAALAAALAALQYQQSLRYSQQLNDGCDYGQSQAIIVPVDQGHGCRQFLRGGY